MKTILTVLLLGLLTTQAPEWEPLHESFANLYSSLQAKGGIAPEDLGVIEALRDRADDFTNRNPDDEQALALELQLSMWMADHGRVDVLFARLAEATGDVDVGVAWARYYRRLNDTKRVAAVYSRLVELFPDEVEVRVTWAEHYKDANLYRRAIEILEAADLDPAQQTQAVVTLSDCLFAEERYAEAVETLERITTETLDANPAAKRTVDQVLPLRREYPELWARELEIRSAEAVADDLPRAELITSQGVIVVELFENEAPNTVANFISLAGTGYYNGIRFHRVIPNFMSQCGDPNSRLDADGTPGQGGPGYRIPDEHEREGARNHFTGSLAMANTGSPNTGGSQFYITHTAPAHLNGKHTVFGRVLEGVDVGRAMEVNDVLESVTILRKRDHEYRPQTLPLEVDDTEPATTRPRRTIVPPGQ